MRGVPDVAYQASSRTGVLVYDTAPGDAESGLICPSGNPCSAGWYVVGGTSASSPQWAGLVAIADQIAGHGLGQINPTLYALASGPSYGTYFYDVTTGNNQARPRPSPATRRQPAGTRSPALARRTPPTLFPLWPQASGRGQHSGCVLGAATCGSPGSRARLFSPARQRHTMLGDAKPSAHQIAAQQIAALGSRAYESQGLGLTLFRNAQSCSLETASLLTSSPWPAGYIDITCVCGS